MMIYGWYKDEFLNNRPKEIDCFNSECEAKNQIIVRGEASIFHIMYIPIFPYKIKHELECESCKREFDFKDMNKNQLKKYGKFKKRKFSQIWYFSGILILFSLITWSNISKNQELNMYLKRLENIEVNRVVEMLDDESKYTTFKVCEVSEETISVNFNKYVVDDKRSIERILDKNNYNQDTIIIKNELLQKWANDKKILSVHW